jgi:hypothetical protein
MGVQVISTSVSRTAVSMSVCREKTASGSSGAISSMNRWTEEARRPQQRTSFSFGKTSFMARRLVRP